MSDSFRRLERLTRTSATAATHAFAGVEPTAFVCAAGGGLHHNNGSQHPGDTALYTLDALVAELDKVLDQQRCSRTLWDEVGGLTCRNTTPGHPRTECHFASSDAPDRHSEPSGHGGHR